jgi:ppGpp synthetase/RelA/SpoT-type nucleotidyltranferase
MTPDTFRTWYSARRSLYEQLAITAEQTLVRLISAANLDVVSVTSRAKSVDSAFSKASRKDYAVPTVDMTDLAAVRVITFIESDLQRVSDIVGRAFDIIPEKSSDKTDALGVDRTGYRSIHFVCTLGEDRVRLPELELFRDLRFEVQVRTAFQHAWAEVEHNRRYKFAGVLPGALQRRLFLLAGMLEIADRELATIASEVDAYAESVANSTKRGDLDIAINSTSVLAYVDERLKELPDLKIEDFQEAIPASLIDELRDFGIHTLADLDRLFVPELLEAIRQHEFETSHTGVIRDAMMFADLERYFVDAWKTRWHATDERLVALLSEKYDREAVVGAFRRHKILIEDDDLFEDHAGDDDEF